MSFYKAVQVYPIQQNKLSFKFVSDIMSLSFTEISQDIEKTVENT